MTPPISALLAHARDVPAGDRRVLAAALRAELAPGTLLLETCHRVELFGGPDAVANAARPALPAVESARGKGVERLDGPAAARHVIALAVGRSSAVLGEDQVLHQLRGAVADARRAGPLPAALDHLLDVALRAGRRARAWLPADRRSLADAALDAAAPGRGSGLVLVVGAGAMGRLVARAAARRGYAIAVANRSADRAAALAKDVDGEAVAFVPDARVLTGTAVVVIALSGPWPLDTAAADALARSTAMIVDLSAPPAIERALSERLGARFTSVDDLAVIAPVATTAASATLVQRLDRLIDATLDEYLGWVEREPERETARALTERARQASAAELEELWRRVPDLGPEEREQVERMAERLAARLLRDPIERLGRDGDGRHRRAAAELFGL